MKLIDSHCHVHMSEFDADREQVIKSAHDAGIEKMIVVGNDHETNLKLVDFIQNQDSCYITLGIHPHYVGEWNANVLSWLKEHMHDEKLIAVGEAGLDYFRNEHTPANQEKVLRAQIELAIEYKKPVVLHVRDAFSDMERILRDYPGLKFVMHCFTGTADDVAWIVEKGGYISLSGIVTFSNAKDLQETAKVIPENHLLVETDAPFLSPQANRGKRCEPSFMVETVQKIAELKNIPLEDLARNTYENTRKAFGF